MKGYWFAVVVGLFLLLGCSKTDTRIYGSWQSGMGGALTQYHFGKDGKFSMTVLFDGMRATAEGTFELDGDRLIMTPTTSNVEGASPNIEQARALVSQQARVHIRWDTPMSFTILSPDSGPNLQITRMAGPP
jgi:hypothetical protein